MQDLSWADDAVLTGPLSCQKPGYNAIRESVTSRISLWKSVLMSTICSENVPTIDIHN